ncbi:hypothetical protein Vadar_007049 [Vaccinium darrowii]|uniref:Uncharacterized protein n=1 Tax=Vaccinium darrowii TaxID=229202 RepID=A0ACB7YD67_9ERIC|nr:hypothetical protein Vadar_007049 [Vaccinium darrowii]
MDTILCDELVEEVLRRLAPRTQFSSSTADVSLVSKRWLRLYRSTRSRLPLRLSPDNCTPPSLSSFLSHFPHLSVLSLSIAAAVADAPVPPAISIFRDQLLLSIASSCPNLTDLQVCSGPVSHFHILSLSTPCPHLTNLYLIVCRPSSFHWLLLFPSLKLLGLIFTLVPGEHVDTASEENFDAELKLETLYLSRIRPGHYGFDWLWKSCKKLTLLRLARCQGIGDDTSASSFVNCSKSLQEVELSSCGSVVNDILSKLVENCTSLNSLLIHDCGSKEGLLQFITRSRCNLRKLDLRLPLVLKTSHLLAVAVNFRGLSSLRLHSCSLVTGEGLKTIGLARSNDLEELALVNCDVVEREPGLLTTLGQNLKKLRKLDLSDNEMLVDEEFISMLASCNCLTELKVRGCKRLTNASMVVSTFKSCEQLESVDIMNCPGIGAEAVELLVLNCLRLRKLHVEKSKLSDASRLLVWKRFIGVFVH